MGFFAELQKASETRFVCAKCGHKECVVDEVAMTGTGLSKFFDIQNRELITISCTRCGYTEIYNERAVAGRNRSASDIIDFLFGG